MMLFDPNIRAACHKRTGQVSCVCVCVGGGGGGGAEVSCPNIFFLHCLHTNQMVLSEYYLFFARKWLFKKF